MFAWVCRINIVYTAIVAFLLLSFCYYQVFALGMLNVTSNEDIRSRWNGHRKNLKAAAMFRRKAGCLQRLIHVVFSQPDDLHGPSRLQQLAQQLDAPLLPKEHLSNKAVLREYGIELPTRSTALYDDSDLVEAFCGFRDGDTD